MKSLEHKNLRYTKNKMNQEEKRTELIRQLLNERPEYQRIDIPASSEEQKHLLRSLFNVRLPGKIDDAFLKIQDEYLLEATREKGITDLSELTPVQDGIYLWQIGRAHV